MNKKSNDLKPKKALPKNRTLKQVRNHYNLEKAIADKLKEANREERRIIYISMYDELFCEVPDHPRLTRRDDEKLTNKVNQRKWAVIKKHIDKSTVFVEFGPGDCKFASNIAKHVKQVYGVDISDQRNINDGFPQNFRLFIYDGYTLDVIEESSVDVVFSDYLIEHLHPEDTEYHFELVFRLLKEGGKYIFRTPHAFTGPHDVSQFFSNEPEGFHLKEWTYREIKVILKKIGYSKVISYWSAKNISFRIPFFCFEVCEMIISLLPGQIANLMSRLVFPRIVCIVIK